MSTKPLVSIVTPSYNQAEFIEQTILSVINQTYTNIQFILVDGGSTDSTMEIVNKYRSFIDIIIHEKDNGQSEAINKGFRLAKGELVGWLNSDDILYPLCVEKIVELYLEKSDGSIYYTSSFNKIDRNGLVLRTISVSIPDRKHLANWDYTVVQPGSFYRTELVKAAGYIDETIRYCMDLDLWLRLSMHGRIYSLDSKPYSGFRIWEGTKTTNGGLKFLKNIRDVLKRNNVKGYSLTILKTYLFSAKLKLKSILPGEARALGRIGVGKIFL